jgi:hypothetical protein
MSESKPRTSPWTKPHKIFCSVCGRRRLSTTQLLEVFKNHFKYSGYTIRLVRSIGKAYNNFCMLISLGAIIAWQSESCLPDLFVPLIRTTCIYLSESLVRFKQKILHEIDFKKM